MRFERARSLLLLGKLQRRRRLKDAATKTFAEALAEFEAMGAPWWADQVRAELTRTNVRHDPAVRLTPSEQQVSELAASGMSNRDIAADTVHQDQDRRAQPDPRLRQAGHPLPRRTRQADGPAARLRLTRGRDTPVMPPKKLLPPPPAKGLDHRRTAKSLDDVVENFDRIVK